MAVSDAKIEQLAKERTAKSNSVSGSGVDQNSLYGEYILQELENRSSRGWRDKLHRKASHKALDIPDPCGEEMGDIKVTNTSQGLGLKEIVAGGAVALGMMGVWQAPAILSAWKAVKAVNQSVDTDTATAIGLGGGTPVDPSTITIESGAGE